VAFDEWAEAREAVLETYLDEAARWPSRWNLTLGALV
jgi:hypothetical protein